MSQYHAERELKILLTREQYEKLLGLYPFARPAVQVNTYYDAQDQLKNARSALRIRQLPDQNVLTLKRPMDEITKKEYEYSIPGSDLDSIPEETWKQIEPYVPERQSLRPIATFTTERAVLDTDQGDFCLDRNVFDHMTDYELEYEYKTDHDGIQVLNEFLRPLGIRYEKNGLSKIQRALDHKKGRS